MTVPLKRTIARLGVLLITLSSITPAASVFIIGQQVIGQAGTGAFLCFAAAAVLGLATAYVYAELSSAFPLTGGEYSIIGQTMGPAWGFMALGLNIFGGALSQAVFGLGLADYLHAAWPAAPVLPIALAANLATTLISVLNIRVNAWITGVFLLVELMALGGVTALGFLHPHRSIIEVAAHPVMAAASGGGLAAASWGVIGLATAGAVFAYNGYGGAVFFGEEMHEARTRLAWVVMWSLAIAVITEFVPVAAMLVGAGDLKAILASPTPLSDFIAQAGGPTLNKAISLGVAFAIFNAMIALSLINARQLYCSARDGAWPALLNRAFGAVHARFHSPWIASLVMGGASMACCFIDLKTVVMLTANGLVMVYAGVSVAVLVGRINGTTAKGHYRMPFFPIAPVFALLVLAGVLWSNITDPETGRPSLIANLAVMILSAAYYWFYLRGRGRWAWRDENGELLSEAKSEGLA